MCIYSDIILPEHEFTKNMIFSRQYHIAVQAYAVGFYVIVKCPFNKIKVWREASNAMEKSYRLIKNNTHLRIRETVPLKGR